MNLKANHKLNTSFTEQQITILRTADVLTFRINADGTGTIDAGKTLRVKGAAAAWTEDAEEIVTRNVVVPIAGIVASSIAKTNGDSAEFSLTPNAQLRSVFRHIRSKDLVTFVAIACEQRLNAELAVRVDRLTVDVQRPRELKKGKRAGDWTSLDYTWNVATHVSADAKNAAVQIVKRAKA